MAFKHNPDGHLGENLPGRPGLSLVCRAHRHAVDGAGPDPRPRPGSGRLRARSFRSRSRGVAGHRGGPHAAARHHGRRHALGVAAPRCPLSPARRGRGPQTRLPRAAAREGSDGPGRARRAVHHDRARDGAVPRLPRRPRAPRVVQDPRHRQRRRHPGRSRQRARAHGRPVRRQPDPARGDREHGEGVRATPPLAARRGEHQVRPRAGVRRGGRRAPGRGVRSGRLGAAEPQQPDAGLPAGTPPDAGGRRLAPGAGALERRQPDRRRVRAPLRPAQSVPGRRCRPRPAR